MQDCHLQQHWASRTETAILPEKSAARREVSEKLGRWHKEKKARSAVLQPLTQDGQQSQEPEAPKWLHELKEEYSQLQVCFGAALWSLVRSVEPAIIAQCTLHLANELVPLSEPAALKSASFAALPQADVKAAGQEAAIVRSHEASGPARQILPDDSFLTEDTVRDAFYACSQKAQHRHRQRKDSSLRKLVTADGQHIIFSAAARNTISKDTVHLIR